MDHREAWSTTKTRIPSETSLPLTQPPPPPRLRLRPIISRRFHRPCHAASTDAECTMFTEALYVPHRVTFGAGYRPPRDPPTHPPAQGIIKHTQACDVRCWTAYWLYPRRRYNATKDEPRDNKKDTSSSPNIWYVQIHQSSVFSSRSTFYGISMTVKLRSGVWTPIDPTWNLVRIYHIYVYVYIK